MARYKVYLSVEYIVEINDPKPDPDTPLCCTAIAKFLLCAVRYTIYFRAILPDSVPKVSSDYWTKRGSDAKS